MQIDWKIINSNNEKMVIEFLTLNNEPKHIKPIQILIGLPNNKIPNIKTSHLHKSNFSQISKKKIEKTKWLSVQQINGLHTATLQFSPFINKNTFSSRSLVEIRFSEDRKPKQIPKKNQNILLSNKVANWNIAKSWISDQKKIRKTVKQYPKGKWIKFSINKDGIHGIRGDELKNVIGQNNDLDPRSIMILTSSSFGRSFTEQITNNPFSHNQLIENLIEIPISILGESDGNFADNDILYFYGKGPSGFEIIKKDVLWNQNLYFTESIYWLLIPNDSSLRGKRIQTANKLPSNDIILNYGLSHIHKEIDLINPNESGLAWAEKTIPRGNSVVNEIELSEATSPFNSSGKIGMIGNEKTPTPFQNTKHNIQYKINGESLGQNTWSNIGKNIFSFSIKNELINNGTNKFTITNTSDNLNSEPMFDYIDFSYSKRLNYNFPFNFYSPIFDSKVTFQIIGKNLTIWNTTDPLKPVNLPLSSIDDTTLLNTELPANSNQRYSVFKIDDISNFSNIQLIDDEIDWNSLSSINNDYEHIIIGPNEFKNQSMALVNHRNKSTYVEIEKIYQQFAGGNEDPIAIRSFLLSAKLNWKNPPIYVLLMGDADFDYRNITNLSKIKVPTIEVGVINSYATDDRFTAFDGLIPEIAIGRFPARTQDEVSSYINKIIQYEKNLNSGSWKQRITLVADDPLRPEKDLSDLYIGTSHTNNSERISKIIPDFIDVNKIYLVEYKEVNNGPISGISKPSATEDLLENIYQGTSIINFIGHGNPTQWAQEKLLTIDDGRNDINNIKTNMKLPLWIAGTCNWGHFDAINKESFAEELIRSEMDGASSIISTTRGITVSSNINFLENIFKKIFAGDSISFNSVGSILQSVKNGSNDGQLFQLLGDPALKLPLQAKINNNNFISSDTLSTLEVGSIEGNTILPSGNGFLSLEDGITEKTIEFFLGSKTHEIKYEKKGNTLYRGSFNFENNKFFAQFRIPKDISYSEKNAIVRFGIFNSTFSEIGSNSKLFLKIGKPSNDVLGPVITFETNKRNNLKNNDYINASEELFIRISDPLGVNITNEEGHEIIIFNPITKKETITTNLFSYDINSLNTGIIPLNNENEEDLLEIGVKAWDNANNPNEQLITLNILRSNQLNVLNVLNFPNPFENDTKFTFELTGNAEVKIDIYTLEGKKIKKIPFEFFQMGYNYIYWDGRDEYGGLLANGVYLYKISVKNDNNEKINKIGRIAIAK